MTRHILTVSLALWTLLALVQTGLAGDCCQRCQCACRCTKVCRLVNEERKVEVVCWGCLTEDFCVNGPSQPGCQHCETVCDPCQQATADAKSDEGKDKDKDKDKDKAKTPKKTPASKPKRFVWTSWIPGSADIFTKKKLMKKTVTKKIPSYKWVVEELCPECLASAESARVEKDSKVPAPPATDAKIIQPVVLPVKP